MFFFYCSDLASPAHMPGTPESHKTETTESGEPTESTKSPTGTYTCVHIIMPMIVPFLSFLIQISILKSIQCILIFNAQGAKKIIFTACHSGKLKLAFTSPDVIITSPKNVLFFCYSNSS